MRAARPGWTSGNGLKAQKQISEASYSAAKALPQARPIIADSRFRALGDVAAGIVADLTRRRASSSWRSTT